MNLQLVMCGAGGNWDRLRFADPPASSPMPLQSVTGCSPEPRNCISFPKAIAPLPPYMLLHILLLLYHKLV